MRNSFAYIVIASLSLCAASTANAEVIDHARIIRNLDDAAYKRGKATYDSFCFACHGKDGKTPTNPLARSFAQGEMANGADPYSLWKTVTFGFNTMPATQASLTPRERYDVVHYVREAFLKRDNPKQYTKVDETYLKTLKITEEETRKLNNQERDYGPVLNAQLQGPANANHGIHFRLPHEVTYSFNAHTFRSNGLWTGGFLDLSQTQHYKQRGERMPKPKGEPIDGLQMFAWQLGDSFDIPKDKQPRGPVSNELAQYFGQYLHGNHAVLSYAIGGRKVLETVGVDKSPVLLAEHHTMHIAAGEKPLSLAVAHVKNRKGAFGLIKEGIKPAAPKGPATGTIAYMDAGESHVATAVVGDTDGLAWEIDNDNRIILTIPASNKPRVIRVVRHGDAGEDAIKSFVEYVRFSASKAKLIDPADMTRGGPERWTTDMTVEGKLGESKNGYALDTIPVPFKNPYNAWIRTSAVDFFKDGRAAVTTHGGDVWIVSGIDDKLEKVTWSRYAAGLFEPFGVRVVDDVVYVTTRDGIVRLHDYDGNGEADFVEAFHVDQDVSSMFHAYNFDLQTDSKGNFYFAKAGQYTHYAKPGTIMKVPPTGGPAEVFAWGIRTPNGMGKLDDDRFTVSDNQGPWMPAGKVSLITKDGFLGNMPTNKSAKDQEAFLKSKHGGELPTTYDEPFIWTPQDLDNSCGGQVWAGDKRWGPLAGRLIHSSFGKGWLYYLSLQEIDGKMQSSIVALPHQWDAGVMRLRVNANDGQVYGVGLSGWQGPRGGKDGCFQRLRYTGDPMRMIEKTRVTDKGIELTFSFPLDKDAANKADSYKAEMWDYLWSRKYGSDQFSVRNPGKKGHDKITVSGIELSDDGRTAHVLMSDLAVCDQLKLDLDLKGADGKAFKERVYFTIHNIPGRK